MSTSVELVTRFVDELWHRKNYRVVDELCDSGFVAHDLPPGMPTERGFKNVAMMVHRAFPDIRFTVEDVIAEDVIAENDKVVIRWASTSTHGGDFIRIPATNRTLCRDGVTIHRLVGGKIVEWWNKSDNLSLMQQLGAIGPKG